MSMDKQVKKVKKNSTLITVHITTVNQNHKCQSESQMSQSSEVGDVQGAGLEVLKERGGGVLVHYALEPLVLGLHISLGTRWWRSSDNASDAQFSVCLLSLETLEEGVQAGVEADDGAESVVPALDVVGGAGQVHEGAFVDGPHGWREQGGFELDLDLEVWGHGGLVSANVGFLEVLGVPFLGLLVASLGAEEFSLSLGVGGRDITCREEGEGC